MRHVEIAVTILFSIRSESMKVVSVVVEKESGVIIESIEFCHGPLPFRVGCREDPISSVVVSFCRIGDEIEVELAVMILERRCPLSLRIAVGVVLQVIRVVVCNLLERVSTILPVDKVL